LRGARDSKAATTSSKLDFGPLEKQLGGMKMYANNTGITLAHMLFSFHFNLK